MGCEPVRTELHHKVQHTCCFQYLLRSLAVYFRGAGSLCKHTEFCPDAGSRSKWKSHTLRLCLRLQGYLDACGRNSNQRSAELLKEKDFICKMPAFVRAFLF